MQKKYVWAGLALAFGAGIIGWKAGTTPERDAHPPQASAVRAPSPSPMPAPTARMPAAQARTDATLVEQVDQLIATHDPENAYKAYWLIAECDWFNRDHDRAVYDIEEVKQKRSVMPYRAMNEREKQQATKLCADMTERMRVSRFDYLAIAANAGVSGAVTQMAEEGPFGDRNALVARPDDPLVKEWKTKVLDLLAKAAEAGDLETLNYLWPQQMIGEGPLVPKNPALAYRYGVALGLIFGDINGPTDTSAEMYAPEGQLMSSVPGLSAEQRAAERAAAQRIANIVHERRLREARKQS